VVTVQKAGFFKAIRTFASKEGGSNFVRLKLIPRQLTGSIDASSGGTVTFPSIFNVTIPANSVVIKSSNLPYSGSIKVYASYIGPTAPEFPDIIPGSLQAIDTQNKRVALKSFGMMAVELESATGEALQIATGKTARIRSLIPSSMMTSAPTSIPLWSLDESTGLWKQEGSATKTGSYYEGDVSHFTFWNCDLGFAGVFVDMTLKSAGGPLQNVMVRVTGLTDGVYVYGNTDSTGYVGGILPKDETFTLEIMNNCDQPIYTQRIGPFSQNTSLGDILINVPLQFNVEIKGNVVNCNNQALPHGSVAIYYEGQLYYTPVTNGLFSMVVTRCPITSTLEIVTRDSAGAQQSPPYTFDVSNSTLNTGTLVACGVSMIGTVTYSIDGVSYSLSTAQGDTITAYTGLSLGGNGTGFKGFYSKKAGSPTTGLVFEYDGNLSTGTFGMVNFAANTLNTFNYVQPFNVNITAWRPVGQFIEGNFNVQILEAGTTFHRIIANFRALRYD
jgi:hypothetical protein